MSEGDSGTDGLGRWQRLHRRLFEAVFGDRTGFFVFILALVSVMALWRVGFVINDTEALANGVGALLDGRLAITDPQYGMQNGVAPGMSRHDGRVYARNYGMVVPAAVLAFALQALRVVFDLQVLLVGLWCSLVAVAVRELSGFVDRERLFLFAGGGLVGVLFVGNVALAEPIRTDSIPIVGLQIWTALATALAGTVAYRLFALELEDRPAATLGLAVVLATPLGFWATIPKRHVVVALAALVVAYSFARQSSRSGLRSRLYRTIPYATAGFLMWVHPGDGGILFVAVLFVDVVFGEFYDARQLALTPLVFGIALLPFLITNTLISGNPVQAPGFLPGYVGDIPLENNTTASGSGSGSGSGSDSPASGDTDYRSLLGLLQGGFGLVMAMTTSVLGLFDRAIGYVTRTLDVFVASPSRVVETFVRSGFVERAANRGADRSINLSYLESMPLAMGVLAGMTHVFREGLAERPTVDVRDLVFRDATGIGRARAFAVVYTAVMILLYQERLPLHTTVTLRFLVPTMPLVLFLVFQAPAFRAAVSDEFSTVLSSYGLTVLVGGEVLAGVFVLSALSVGEAVQLHALIALVVAGALAIWMLAGAVRDGPRSVRVGAVLIGMAFGVTTAFLVLSAFVHFPYGRFLLPISGGLSALFS